MHPKLHSAAQQQYKQLISSYSRQPTQVNVPKIAAQQDKRRRAVHIVLACAYVCLRVNAVLLAPAQVEGHVDTTSGQFSGFVHPPTFTRHSNPSSSCTVLLRKEINYTAVDCHVPTWTLGIGSRAAGTPVQIAALCHY